MPYSYQKNAAGEYVCPHCHAVKRNQNTMHYHLKKHEGHPPHRCGTCHKEFLQASTLALHIAARHGTPATAAGACPTRGYACPVCPCKTLTKANRILHFLRHHCPDAVVPAATDATNCVGPAIGCKSCGKRCNSATAYLYHIGTSRGRCYTPADRERQAQLEGLLV